MKPFSAVRAACLVFATFAAAASAEGLDRDSVVAEAPATPASGNVRLTGGAGSATGDVGANTRINGTVMWTPFTHFAADVGAYFQGGSAGPAARVRYQFLSQDAHGVDMAVGVRYKTVGFNPGASELELLLAAGRRVGSLDLILNLVGGKGLEEEGETDAELAALIAYRFNDAFRVGLDGRVQLEVGPRGIEGSRTAFIAGPAASYLLLGEKLQLQLLIGALKARGLGPTGFGGRLTASFDF